MLAVESQPVTTLDHRGQPKLDPVTRLPLYTTITEPNLAFAVDSFVESDGVEPEGAIVGAARLS